MPCAPLLVLLVGCVGPGGDEGDPPPLPRVRDHVLRHPTTEPNALTWEVRTDIARQTRLSWSLRDGGDLPVLDPVPDSPITTVTNPIEDADADFEVGVALEEALAEFPADVVRYYGVARLTIAEQFGTEDEPGLCESPNVLFEFDEDGTTWEASFQIPGYTHLADEIRVIEGWPSDACVAAMLDAGGGDLDALVESGDCSDIDLVSFIDADPTCRACLEETGDWFGCEDAEECEQTYPIQLWFQEHGEYVWYHWMQSPMFACAPDWFSVVDLIGHLGEDGSLPELWDHTSWNYLCRTFWDDDVGGPQSYCQWGAGRPDQGDTVGQGSYGYVNYLRERGTTATPWARRGFYVTSVDLRWHDLRWYWAINPGIGSVSGDPWWEDTDGSGDIGPGDDGYGHPWGYAWGLNPMDQRADGDSEARDFIATEILKSSTTISGIWVSAYNHSRCAEDAWVDMGDGTWHCTRMLPPAAGWAEDGEVSWTDAERRVPIFTPMATIASSGLPDPDIPGGFITHLASSAAMALPEWEDCTFEHTFQPDTAVIEDLPNTFPGAGALVGHTYRFGKDDSNIRVVMNTNMWRGYCPEGGP